VLDTTKEEGARVGMRRKWIMIPQGASLGQGE